MESGLCFRYKVTTFIVLPLNANQTQTSNVLAPPTQRAHLSLQVPVCYMRRRGRTVDGESRVCGGRVCVCAVANGLWSEGGGTGNQKRSLGQNAYTPITS